tara:strand:- start:473 stop:961 length:489 start_codon:yes stop_codon:yes gene_type:complete
MASTLKVNTIAHSGGTNAMTIDSAGRIFQPTKPFISLLRNVDADYTAGTVVNGYRIADSRGITYNDTTGIMTVPVAGLYMIYICGIINSSAGIFLEIEGVTIHRIIYNQESSGDWDSVSGQHLVQLNANDEIRFVASNGTMSMYGSTSASGAVGGAGMYLIG